MKPNIVIIMADQLAPHFCAYGTRLQKLQILIPLQNVE